MICPECGFKNSAKTDFCRECGKTLTLANKYPFRAESKNTLSILFILIIIVIGFSGAGYVQTVSGSSLSTANVPSTTVKVEEGFSGTITIKDPIFNKTSNVTVNYQPYSYGSGFIVNKNGYIITSFHVLSDSRTLESKNQLKNMSSSDIKWYVEEAGLMEYLKKDPILAYKLFKDVPKTQEDRRKALEKATDDFIKNGWISASSYKYDIYVKGNTLHSVNAQNSLKASLVGFGNTANGEDIALLKVNTNSKNLPVLAVSSNSPKIGDKISIYGYPASSNSSSPSKSSGSINTKAPNYQGTVYYETNAITSEGYSGGPVINSQNKIIGILSFGAYDEKSKKVVGSIFLSSSYIQKICKKYKVPFVT